MVIAIAGVDIIIKASMMTVMFLNGIISILTPRVYSILKFLINYDK